MGVKFLFGVLLIIAASLIIFLAAFELSLSFNEKTEQPKAAIYIAEEPQAKTYIVGEDSPAAWADAAKTKRQELNTARSLRRFEDEQAEFEIKSKLKNVRRAVDGKVIFGFDKELDNPGFEDADS